MSFKYYDLLSCIVMGYIAMFAGMFFFEMPYDKDWAIPYMSIAYVIGYMINAIGNMLEKCYYKTIGGMPSDNLLKVDPMKTWTGIEKVKFFSHKKW